MADAKPEQIINAIVTAVTGLTTTGANVQRGQVYNHEETKLPALAVMMGDDLFAEEYQTDLVDWELTVLIESTASVAASYTTQSSLIDQVLNQIRKEVHAAVMADHKQGLSFVIDTDAIGASKPELSGEGALPIGSQILTFIVRYRANRQDISL